MYLHPPVLHALNGRSLYAPNRSRFKLFKVHFLNTIVSLKTTTLIFSLNQKGFYSLNQNTIVVGENKLRGKYIFLATGSKPRKLNIPGAKYITTSEEFMEAEKLPERIIFIGGGHISLEFAHIARRAGSDVTILHRSEHLLKSFDSDMANLLIKASEAIGIKILTNRQVISIEKKADNFLVSTEFKSKTKSETQSFRVDMVVHGAGRVPDT
jgi:glutathione reductase (NADPH)